MDRRAISYSDGILASAIILSGLSIPSGYAILDEFACAAIVAYFACGVLRRRHALSDLWRSGDGRAAWAWLPTSLLIMYLLLHALVAFYAHPGFATFRWIAYFLILGGIALIWRVELEGRQFTLSRATVIAAGAAYFTIYLLHWWVVDVLLGLKWEELQTVTWTGSTYAMLPAVVVLPAILLQAGRVGQPGPMVWLSLIAFATCSILYSSRIGIIVSLLFVVLAVTVCQRRFLGAMLAICMLGTQLTSIVGINFVHSDPGRPIEDRLIWSIQKTTADLAEYRDMILQSVQMPVRPRVSDEDRHSHITCMSAIMQNADPVHTLTGFGLNAHRQLLSGCYWIKRLRADESPVRSSAAIAVVIDFGLVAVGLLGAVIVARFIDMRPPPRDGIIIAGFLLACLAWGLVTDYRDNLTAIIFLLFCPPMYFGEKALEAVGGRRMAVSGSS